MAASLAGTALVAFCALWPLRHLELQIDIDPYDEAIYAVYYWGEAFRIYFYAPLYSGWYTLLQFLNPHLDEVFYLNWRLGSVAAGLGVFTFFRVCRWPLWAAVWVGVALSASPYLITVQPRVSLFSAAVLFWGFSLALAWGKRPLPAGALAALTLLAASYVRPEFFLAFLALVGVGILAIAVALFKGHRFYKYDIRLGSICGVLSLVVLAWLGPATSHSGNRDTLAFYQHFALNTNEQGLTQVKNWDEPGPVAEKYFKSAPTLSGIIHNNPAMYLWHLKVNGRRIALGIITGPGEVLLPHYVFPLPGIVRHGLAWAVLLAAFFFAIKGRKTVVGNAPAIGMVALAALLVVGLYITIMAMVYPRQHYQLTMVAGWFLLLGLLGYFIPFRDLRLQLRFGLPPWVLPLLLFLPAAIIALRLPEPTTWSPASGQRLAVAVQALRQEAVGGNVLCPGMTAAYAGRSFFSIHHRGKQGPLQSFLIKKNIVAVIVNYEMRENPAYSKDPNWPVFLEHPEALGFRNVPLQAPGISLYVRANVQRGSAAR
jgi:hypothetical protein